MKLKKHQIGHIKIKGRERTRFIVRMRDKFTCQDCGDIRTPEQAKLSKKRLFDVHHKNNLCGKKSRSYDSVSDIDGLITLCHKCHFNRPEHRVKSEEYAKNISKRPSDYRKRKRDEEIFIMRMHGNATLSSIGKKFGISHQRVSQIIEKVQQKTIIRVGEERW